MLPKLRKVKLVRHGFEDKPEWTIVNEDIPLGTIYEVAFTLPKNAMTILNQDTKEERQVSVHMMTRDNGKSWGYIPVDCFEPVEDQDGNAGG